MKKNELKNKKKQKSDMVSSVGKFSNWRNMVLHNK